MAWHEDREGEISGATTAATNSPEQFESAYQRLRADGSTQFNLPPAERPAETPGWLKAFFEWLGDVLVPVADFVRWISSFMPDAPYARLFLWTLIAAAVAAVVYLCWERIRSGEWRLPRRRSPQTLDAEEEEEEEVAFQPRHSWLQEADALAGKGMFAEAVHHLLYRSIEDIAYRRPQLVRPALTSREIAGADAIPPKPRELFARIAALVERSLFGGRPVNADDWSLARAAYADLAVSRSWRA